MNTRLFALGLGGVIALAAAPAFATTITVTTTADDNTTGNCSLREAVQAAETGLAVDKCPAGGAINTINLPGGVIAYNGPDYLRLTKSTTINGAGHQVTTIGFNNSGAGFLIGKSSGGNNMTVHLRYLTLRQGSVTTNAGTTTNLSFVNITGDKAEAFVDSGSTLNMSDTFVSNVAGYAPLLSYGTVNVSNTTFLNNLGEGAGAIFSTGSLTVSTSTFANNVVQGADFLGTNTYQGASAIFTDCGASTSITGSTIAYNKNQDISAKCNTTNCGAVTAGAAFNGVPAGTVTIQSSVVAQNTVVNRTTYVDCAGSLSSHGYNLLGTTASNGCPKTATDLTPQDPKLTTTGSPSFAPVWQAGVGPVYVPQAASPLLNAIPASNSLCANVARDQRGMMRGRNGGCEPGAVERSSAILVVDNPASLNTGDQKTLTILQGLGFAVTVIDDDQVNAATANGIHLVAISESVTSGKIGTKLRTIDSSVFCMEPSLYDDMDMTGPTDGTNYGNSGGQAFVDVRPTSFGQRLGTAGTPQTVLEFVTNTGQTFGWGVPSASATINVTMDDVTSHAAVFAYYKTNALFSGASAPANRVGFFAFPATVADLNSFGGPSAGGASGKGMMMQAIIDAAGN